MMSAIHVSLSVNLSVGLFPLACLRPLSMYSFSFSCSTNTYLDIDAGYVEGLLLLSRAGHVVVELLALLVPLDRVELVAGPQLVVAGDVDGLSLLSQRRKAQAHVQAVLLLTGRPRRCQQAAVAAVNRCRLNNTWEENRH